MHSYRYVIGGCDAADDLLAVGSSDRRIRLFTIKEARKENGDNKDTPTTDEGAINGKELQLVETLGPLAYPIHSLCVAEDTGIVSGDSGGTLSLFSDYTPDQVKVLKIIYIPYNTFLVAGSWGRDKGGGDVGTHASSNLWKYGVYPGNLK